MFLNFNEDVRKCLINSKLEMSKLKHAYIGTEHLILSILSNENLQATKIFNKYNINYTNFKNRLLKTMGEGTEEKKYYLYTPLLKRIIEEAMIKAKDNNSQTVTVEYLISSLLEEGEGVAFRIMLSMKINIEKLSSEFINNNIRKKLFHKKKLTIEEYGYNMNEKAQNQELDPVIGREEEINRIIEILCRRTKNNPLIIGEAGVGKTAIVEELSKKIVEGTVPESLKKKKIISISMASLVGGTKYRGEFEERINKLLHEIEEYPEIILFIDEIHTLVGAGGAEGAIDASNILKPFLARGKLKIIGATTIAEYKKYLEDDKALNRRFQTILIEEPNEEQVVKILQKLKPIYEIYHHVIIPDEVIKTIVTLSNKYIYDRMQPDKAIDILDEACSKVAISKDKKSINLEKLNLELNKIKKEKKNSIINQNFTLASSLKEKQNDLQSKINKIELKYIEKQNNKKITLKTIADVIKDKSNMPVYEICNDDLRKLNQIEKELNSKVVGQKNTVNELCNDIKRIKLGYRSKNKPQSYIFVGPTGVGKTMLVKELSKIISGKNNLIRLDMSEYKEEHSISKIIGAPPGYVGYENKNSILNEVKLKPNAIILLDEIEKANLSVINLFLQILDEGQIKNSNGENIRFDNNIIIMTSNIGYKDKSIGFCTKSSENLMTELKNILGIEFVNRIDKIMFFNRLNKNDIKKVIKNQIIDMKKEYDLSNVKIDFFEEIIIKSEYEKYGARRISKLLKERVFDLLIEKKLKNVNKTTETV